MSSTGEEAAGSDVVESSPSVAMEAKLILSSSHVDCQKSKDILSKENAAPMIAVMLFSEGKESSSSTAEAKAPAMALDAKVMVSTGHGECQKLKNLLNKKDTTITMVMTTSCSQASKAEPALNRLELQFLAAASKGHLEKLKSLLNSDSPNGTSYGTDAKLSQGIIPGEQVFHEGIIPTERMEEDINVASPSAAQLQVVTVEGDSKREKVIIPVQLEGINVAAPSAMSSLLKVVTVEGDTALHLVATNGAKGDNTEYESCAEFIHQKDRNLIYERNKKGETALHCAVRAGNFQLVSCLIRLAEHDGKVQDLLRMNNDNKETPLHEAVRRRDNKMVERLLEADQELPCHYPLEGTSPLYLAIQQGEYGTILQTLYNENIDASLSYLGPHGQNALHAAVLRGPEVTKSLLLWNKYLRYRWNKDLTIQKDKNGSTPLHFAAGLIGANRRGSVCSQLLKDNSDALFQLDKNGLSPIHVAASVGAFNAIALFLKECPGSAGLRDSKGRTFLHVAVENKQLWTIFWTCMDLFMHPLNKHSQWILNMQDKDGNTALHLAVKAGNLVIFAALFFNGKVDMNTANAEGQTPLDIAINMVPPGMLFYNQNAEVKIRNVLKTAGASSLGASRRDLFTKKYRDIHSEHESKEVEKLKDLTQAQSITSVLIATVAFGATFALPGGYRADDHTNGGTPTLAGRYAFDAFIMANTLAFIFSSGAIICIARGGSPMFNRQSRAVYLGITFSFMKISVTCFTAAFALGVFLVLSPVAHKTAVAICVLSPLVVLCNNAEFWLKWLILAPSYWVRKGRIWTICFYIGLIVWNTFYEFWPFLLIFLWAAYGRTQVEPQAQKPLV